jgi:hypothetical protein
MRSPGNIWRLKERRFETAVVRSRAVAAPLCLPAEAPRRRVGALPRTATERRGYSSMTTPGPLAVIEP